MSAERGAPASTATDLSVVVCSAGRASAGAAIASILASIAAAEVTAEVVLVWQGREPPVGTPDAARVLHIAPAGLAYARNVGLFAARADRVAFVDDDEVAAPSWAGGVLAGFADGADAVFGPVEPMDEEGRPHCLLIGDRARWIARHERPWQVGTGGNMAASREALAQAGGFDTRLGLGSFGRSGEDTNLIARLQRSGAKLRWRPEMTVAHPTVTDAQVLASRYPYGFGAGRVIRNLRSLPLAARYGIDLARATRDALRSRNARQRRELAATARGFAEGLLSRDRWRAPEENLDRVPAELRSALRGEPAEGWLVPHRPDPHFLYGIGDERLLHLYPDPRPGQREALRARETLAARGLPAGVPRLYMAAESATELWVLEERLPGAAATPAASPAWWPGAVDLLVELGRRTGPPLRQGRWWRQLRNELPDRAPPAWRDALTGALEEIADLPSVVAHGDVQPKNLVVTDRVVGLVDWDGAIAEGLPGLDLLFLATTTRSGRPDAAALEAAVLGPDRPGTPVRDALGAIGLDGRPLRAVALVALAIWAAAEASTSERSLGAHTRLRVFRELLDAVGPRLAGDDAEAQSAPVSRSISA